MKLKEAKAVSERFRRTSWGCSNKTQYIYFDGKNYRKLSGRVVNLSEEDLNADDWEISNPVRNKTLTKLKREQKEREQAIKIMDGYARGWRKL